MSTSTKIEWRPIRGFEGYEVSNRGGVRSWRGCGVRMLSPAVARGYHKVSLRRGSKTVTRVVHHLVLLAFVGPRRGRWTNHKNGVKTDNRVSNLEWCSPSRNLEHAYRTGMMPSRLGEGNPRARLSRSMVVEIRAARRRGDRVLDLARQHGVSKTTIVNASAGTTWSHIP